METKKQRIEFIDLAKGVCILLVVLSHTHVDVPFLLYIRMPLYFLLSGLFFKLYDGFVDFSIRKTNKILIPFLFFYLISFGIYLLIRHFLPDIKINTVVDEFYFTDPLFSRLCFNNPLWFLISLFTVNIIFYISLSCNKHIIFQSVVAILCAIAAFIIKDADIKVPLYLGNTLFYYPFFFFGYYLKSTNLLIESDKKGGWKKDLFLAGILVIAGIVLVIFPIHYNIKAYFIGLAWVVALLLVLKQIKRVPVISYYGRYSIIILCTSYLVYSPLQVIVRKIVNWSDIPCNLFVFLLTILIELIVIKLCLKYLPHVTAQKDIFTYKKGKKKQ